MGLKRDIKREVDSDGASTSYDQWKTEEDSRMKQVQEHLNLKEHSRYSF